MLKLLNTLTRQKEEFKPISTDIVKLYTCGPTVYNYAHLGNLRSFLFYDTLRRTLGLSGLRVKHVMNITDVGHLESDGDSGEDKLEKGAAREGKSVQEVAQHYTKAFIKDRDAVNILPPQELIKATDKIPEQVELVRLLLEKGYAYQATEAIYFDVTKLPTYGKLSGQRLEEKAVGARAEVVTDTAKRNPQDFAVWFFTVGRFKDHSMHWPSPWGEGFPGWHLECSAIIHASLEEPIDIHTGGVDHIGTHHTNEIAQTEAGYSKSLANYWLHNEFMLVKGQKMAKSLGNTYTLADLEQKGFQALAFRLLVLQTHYRSQLNFTWESLTAAQSFLKSLYAFADLQFQIQPLGKPTPLLVATRQQMLERLQDDLDTPKALAILSGAIDKLGADTSNLDQTAFKQFLEFLDQALGLDFLSRQDITAALKDVIKSREAARAVKDFSKADELRQQLLSQGIELNDSATTTVWFRS